MVLERLPRRDLGDEYPFLTGPEKRALAGRIAGIQARVATLPPGPGFGFARSYGDPSLHASWLDVIHAELERSRRRIQNAGAVGTEVVDRVAAAVERYRGALERVHPVPFLDDTTTKNVIVHRGELSGIVDVDFVCFGDPLFTVGLTQMSLLAKGYDNTYIEEWLEVVRATAQDREIATLYTAVFAVNFLGELGQRFNREVPIPPDKEQISRLRWILDALLLRLA